MCRVKRHLRFGLNQPLARLRSPMTVGSSERRIAASQQCTPPLSLLTFDGTA